MNEDPAIEAFVLSLLEGYGVDEAEAMETEVVVGELVKNLTPSKRRVCRNS
jgi:hypothetical protein